MTINSYKKINLYSYNEIISNPWSWFYQAEFLYENALGLYGLYWLGRIRDIEACKEMVKKHNMIDKINNEYDTDPDPAVLALLESLKEYVPHIPSVAKIVPVYMMIMGMAIENLVKGIRVGRKLREFKQNNDSGTTNNLTLKVLGIKGHKAPEWIKEMGIYVNDFELSLIRDANEHLVWSGRYAVPSGAEVPILPMTVMDLTTQEGDMILKILPDIYNRLDGIFKSENGEFASDDLIRKITLNR